MSRELRNCPRCGRLYLYTVREICPYCRNQIEEEFQKVYQYIRKKENRQCSIYEVSEATGVSVPQITEFIRQGRILTAEFPNLAYPCERCGENLILEGNLCAACMAELQTEVKKVLFEAEKKGMRPGRRKHEKYYLRGMKEE